MKPNLATVLAALLAASVFSTASGAPAKATLGTPQIYKKVSGRDLRVYTVLPEKWTPRDERPAVVIFHGGGWVQGTPAAMNRHASHFASKGMVCFLVEYRLLPKKGADTPAMCMRDARSAMRWVRGHANEFGVDPARIAACGGSAGGQLAASTALINSPDFDEPGEATVTSHRPDALILFNPVIDNGPDGYGHKRTGDDYRSFSPFHNVTPGAPPAIILCGTADKYIPVKMLRDFEAAMKTVGARCEVRLYDGQKHGFYLGDGKYQNLACSEADAFLTSLGWLVSKTPR
ncbi:alpha/beta hydrolase [Termitidicoccus mucosus]|uniref:Alpha/beta hydrolase fold-3 domain-containing protein n=1 Tax=Termitidicoccus mucosus TaxID=1184151 RepID=A0A178IIF6_9BACT|nr:hypothetical protein AW736_12030 [Opitutaceae bacterium TSB47]